RREPPRLRLDRLDRGVAAAHARGDLLGLLTVAGQPARALARLELAVGVERGRAGLGGPEPDAAVRRRVLGRAAPAELAPHLAVVLGPEAPGRALALAQPRGGWRRRAPHREQLAPRGRAPRDRVRAGQVHADEPVRAATSARGVGQAVELALRAEPGEP